MNESWPLSCKIQAQEPPRIAARAAAEGMARTLSEVVRRADRIALADGLEIGPKTGIEA